MMHNRVENLNKSADNFMTQFYILCSDSNYKIQFETKTIEKKKKIDNLSPILSQTDLRLDTIFQHRVLSLRSTAPKLGLAMGSNLVQSSTKSLRPRMTFFPAASNDSGTFTGGILTWYGVFSHMACNATWVDPSKGRFRSIISHKVTPNDQTSIFKAHSVSSSTAE